MDDVQKLVDERVQAKLAGLEARLDEKYRNLLHPAEERPLVILISSLL